MTLDATSGASTPLSSTSTLSPSTPPSSAKVTLPENVYKQPQFSASDIIEFIASRSATTSTVHIYDLAEQIGFGTLTKSWSECDRDNTAAVVSLQTRAGAGLSLVGRLSEGTSQDTVKGALLSSFTTPTGLAAMAQSLSYLPSAVPSSRLVIQVPTVTTVGETFSLSPTLSPLTNVMSVLPTSMVVLLSATPQESVDLAQLSYRLTKSHVIHLFDHFSSSRETGHSILPPSPVPANDGLAVSDIIRQSGYTFFDYIGDKEAHTVAVLLNGPMALAVKAVAAKTAGLGVIVVRVLRPWDEGSLRAIIPSTTMALHVFDDVPNETTQGPLYVDVLSSFLGSKAAPSVHAHRIIPAQTQLFVTQPTTFIEVLSKIAPTTFKTARVFESPTLKKLLFFSTPKTPLSALPNLIEQLFVANTTFSTRHLTVYDVFSKNHGVAADRILLAPTGDETTTIPIPFTLPISGNSLGEADFLGILDQAFLKTHSLLVNAKPGSIVLVASSWSSPELLATLSPEVTSLILERRLHMYLIDAKALASKLAGASGLAQDSLQALVAHLAFLRLYLGNTATETLVLKVARTSFSETVQGIELTKVNAHAWAALEKVDVVVDEPSTTNSEPKSTPAPMKEFEFNSITVPMDDEDTAIDRAFLGSWHDAAKHLIFPSVFDATGYACEDEEYPQILSLRPEIPERTFLVKTAVNRRLTPNEYDRNVFHLEFDTSGTGLKYSIGEALGVHGWNDEQDVINFCRFYNADPNKVVTIPVAGSDGTLHTRTTFQALQQQIDLFGRPPKSFYTGLAACATNPIDKYALLFIGSPEGSATFKKLAETDTISFADVLQRYASARPGIERLCELVGDIKPRHYSIASAQSVVGDRVDLLVVSVDWVTPSGSPRFGQCTRYLAGLKVGQQATVSIKPSVMKLPLNDSQPIIMAGLGTGAAPFRAFLQHRAWLAQKDIAVGPTYYYFGSRHQSQEYLYGEEIEAYILDGTISRAGLAFSRDGPKKVYIQHLMLEDAKALAEMLHDDNGVFYLCGPTWPVPDVYEALVGALGKYKGLDPETAGAFLEGLKEEERYVLEVY